MMTIPAPVLLAVVLQLLMAVSATGQFTMEPLSVVQAERLEAVFECLYPGANSHNWGINGNFPPESDFPLDGVVRQTPAEGDTPARLFIPATEEYNNTVVQCVAVVIQEGGLVPSENATLQIQGHLLPPINTVLANDQTSCTNITISWDPPFSLNLTTAEPDIEYCVDVYTVTGGGADMLESVCNITDTSYTFYLDRAGGEFDCTVSARSNVPGSMDGTSSEMLHYTFAPPEVPIEDVDFFTNVVLDPITITFPMNMTDMCRRPNNFIIRAQFIDEQANDSTPDNCSTTVVMEDNFVHLEVPCDSLKERHRRCYLSVIAENNVSSTESEAMNISTHDVYKVSAAQHADRVIIRSEYLENSNETGFLAIVYSPSHSSIKHHARLRNGLENVTTLAISGVEGDDCMLAVYDLFEILDGEEGYPAGLYAIDDADVDVDYDTPSPSSAIDVEVTTIDGEICLKCSTSSCVGFIHSAQLENLTLTVLTVDSSEGMECTENLTEGVYYVAMFGLSAQGLEESPAKQTKVDTCPSTTTAGTSERATEPPVPVNTRVVLGGVIGVIGAVLVLVLIAIPIVYLYRKKGTYKTQNASLIDNEYEGTHIYFEQPVAASGPPPPPAAAVVNTPDLEHETVLSETSSDSPPSYHHVTSSTPTKMSYAGAGSSLIYLESTGVPEAELQHLPPFLQRQDSVESEGLEASSITPFFASKVRLGVQHVHHGTDSLSSLAGVEQPTVQPNLELPTEVNTKSSTTEPAYDNIPRGTKVKPANPSQQPPPQPQLGEFTPQEPAYDVVNKVMVKQATTTDLPADGTKTEHQYSEIQGTVTMSGAHYAHVDLKSKTQESSVDPTTVVYSEVDKNKLAPVSESETPQPKPVTKPPPPPPPTVETVLYEIHPVAKSWHELGEALGVPESVLDNIDTEGSDQVRLHDMIQTYFSNRYYTHTWERIAEALHEIGETEAADRIVRTRQLKVTLSTPPVQADPPPLPPRNGTPEGSNGEAKHGGLQQNKKELDDIENEQYTGGAKFTSSSDQASDDKETAGRKTEILRQTRVNPAVALKSSKDFVSTESQVENNGNTTPHYVPAHDWTVTMERSEQECTLLSNQSSHSDTPFRTLMLHSLEIFKKLDVSKNRKIRALGYMNSNRSASEMEKFYQEKMSETLKQADAATNNDCAVIQECGELGGTSLVSLVTINTNLYTKTGYSKAQKGMASYYGKEFQSTCLASAVKNSMPENTGLGTSMTALVTGVKCEVAVISDGQLMTGVGPKQAVLSGAREKSSGSVSGYSDTKQEMHLLETHKMTAPQESLTEHLLEADKGTAQNTKHLLQADKGTTQSTEHLLQADKGTAQSTEHLLKADIGTAQSTEQLLEADIGTAQSTEHLLEADIGTAQSTEHLLKADKGTAQNREHLLEADKGTAQSTEQFLEADKGTTQSTEQGSHCSSFFSLPGPFHYKWCGHRLKGTLMREHGCIFQPEDEDTCLLGSAAASGELVLDNDVKLLALFSEPWLKFLSKLIKGLVRIENGVTPLTVTGMGPLLLVTSRTSNGELDKTVKLYQHDRFLP